MFYRQGQEKCCVSVTFCDTMQVPSSATGYETSQVCSAFMGVGLDIFPRSTYISSVSRSVFVHEIGNACIIINKCFLHVHLQTKLISLKLCILSYFLILCAL
jgi:hypothetical protein